MAVELRRRRFTVDEYERMAETGILDEDERVELIEGEIVELSPIGPPHSSIVARMTAVLVPRLAGRAILWSQSSLLLRAQASYFQPDRSCCGRGTTTIARPIPSRAMPCWWSR